MTAVGHQRPKPVGGKSDRRGVEAACLEERGMAGIRGNSAIPRTSSFLLSGGTRAFSRLSLIGVKIA
jgi:hypothetical protein